jgi:hypothetical protein
VSDAEVSTADVAALRAVAVELSAIPARENATAAGVAADLARVAHAGEAGPEDLRAVLSHLALDDAIAFLEFATIEANTSARREVALRRGHARAILLRLKAARRASHDIEGEGDTPAEPDDVDPA